MNSAWSQWMNQVMVWWWLSVQSNETVFWDQGKQRYSLNSTPESEWKYPPTTAAFSFNPQLQCFQLHTAQLAVFLVAALLTPTGWLGRLRGVGVKICRRLFEPPRVRRPPSEAPRCQGKRSSWCLHVYRRKHMAVYTHPRGAVGVAAAGSAVHGDLAFANREKRGEMPKKTTNKSKKHQQITFCSCNWPKTPRHIHQIFIGHLSWITTWWEFSPFYLKIIQKQFWL